MIAGTSRASALPCWANYPLAWAILGLLAVQLHLLMFHMLYVETDERYGALDKRLRAGRAQATVVDEVPARPDLTASGAAATAALALEDLKFRHLALSADLLLSDAERSGGARLADVKGENSSRAAPAERIVAGAPVVPAGSAEDEEEPRMQWEGDWVDFGKPASDSLIRLRVDGAVAAGLQYISWDRWR